jgi:hypothetical protein
MATVVNKLKGTLLLGTTPPTTGVQMEMQVTKVGFPQTVTRDSPVTVLTGDLIQAAATYSWSLSGEALLDLSNKAGVFYFVRANQGTQMAFSFLPIGAAAGPTITGTVIVDGWSTEEIAAGSNIVSKFVWPIQGQITITPPAITAEEADEILAADA